MRIILSPAKKMRRDEELLPETVPVFLNRAEELLGALRSLTAGQRQKLWKCSDRLAQENEENLSHLDLYRNPSCALFSYVGLAYQYLSAESLEEQSFVYLQNTLRILSGFYGVVRPMDGIVPYRLEMAASLSVNGCKDLYAFWNSMLYEEVMKDEDVLINLASEEYAKAVVPYVQKEKVVHIVFADQGKKGLVTKGTFAKMARGAMTRWMAENRIENAEDLKGFAEGYRFLERESDESHYVFLKNRT